MMACNSVKPRPVSWQVRLSGEGSPSKIWGFLCEEGDLTIELLCWTHHYPFFIHLCSNIDRTIKVEMLLSKTTIDPLNMGLKPAKLVDLITKKEGLPAKMANAIGSIFQGKSEGNLMVFTINCFSGKPSFKQILDGTELHHGWYKRTGNLLFLTRSKSRQCVSVPFWPILTHCDNIRDLVKFGYPLSFSLCLPHVKYMRHNLDDNLGPPMLRTPQIFIKMAMSWLF